MSTYRFTTRVGYPDVDMNFKLTMPGAMRMMQEAAIYHSDQSGYSFKTMDKTRVHWIVVGWRVRMVNEAGWGETLHVNTWPRTMSRVTSERDFRITNEQGETICIATSNWILVNLDTGRAARVTPELAAAYDLDPTPVFPEPLSPIPLDDGVETYVGTVLRRDIDSNHHVNNLIYLDYAKQAMPEDVYSRPFKELAVRYSRELLLGDVFHCIYHHQDGCHTVELLSETGTKHAQVTFME